MNTSTGNLYIRNSTACVRIKGTQIPRGNPGTQNKKGASQSSRADSFIFLHVDVWALTDLNVEEEGAGWRVAISFTFQRHIISFYNRTFGHDLKVNLLRWI